MIIDGKHINLVSVTPDDAEFILSLRLDVNRGRYLSKIENDLQAQREWINSYLTRERRGEEYYFVITEKSGERLGTVRVYDFKGDSFSWGSWVMRPGNPSYAAIESALCVYEFAFVALGFARCHFEVRKENQKVIAFHTRFGAAIVGEDDLHYNFELSRIDYLATRKKYVKYLTEEQQG
jgi:RimJ/RimL family protein N-acetyltransferase